MYEQTVWLTMPIAVHRSLVVLEGEVLVMYRRTTVRSEVLTSVTVKSTLLSTKTHVMTSQEIVTFINNSIYPVHHSLMMETDQVSETLDFYS